MKLFTYGTLRRGERNHPMLNNRHATFLTDDSIDAEICGHYGDIPLIREGGGLVTGEVYEVPEAGLFALDTFEGTDHGLYERRKVLTHSGIEAWVYFPGDELLQHQG